MYLYDILKIADRFAPANPHTKQDNKMKRLLFTLALLFACIITDAQSYAIGVKGGLTVGFQQWDNSFQRDPLYRYHGILSVESADEEEPFSIFAQLGYHVKGSAIRTFATTFRSTSGALVDVPSRETPFEFRNVSLTLGGKQKFPFGAAQAYYLLGIRGDYTVSTQLRPDNIDDESQYAILYPLDEFVQKWNYGVTVGGGLEFGISEFVSTLVELTVNPDFSRQYLQPEIPNVANPNPNGTNSLITIRERQIVNTTIELTLGFRFLRKIEYID